ncbi:hypothetical protein [Azotosporobacter soli]|uniref:hypothetical protein n=1 Tax=Azotosporobacter soli TaxID=3055040 RepID=UPI0031FF3B62
MKYKAILCGAMIACCFWSASGETAPTLHGDTGLLESPSADVLASGKGDLGIWQGDGWRRQSVAVGLPGGWEMAHGWRFAQGQATQEESSVKLSLQPETVLTPGLAIGAESGGSLYGVASKFLPGGYRLHLGVGSGRFDGVFGGIEKVLNPPHFSKGKTSNSQPTLRAVADFDGHGLQYGLRAAWQNGWQSQIAYGHDRWYGGVTLNW